MDQQQFIDFVRQRGLAVMAIRGAAGALQAALVGIAATGEASWSSTRVEVLGSNRNLAALAHVTLVIGLDNELTVQCEGTADIPTGVDRDRCLHAYFAQDPDGVERPALTPSRTFVSARVGCGTAITGLCPSPWRKPF